MARTDVLKDGDGRPDIASLIAFLVLVTKSLVTL